MKSRLLFSMSARTGFPVKRTYPGQKGLYIEFFNPQDALSFYAKALDKGSTCFEVQDSTTVIMKPKESSAEDDSSDSIRQI